MTSATLPARPTIDADVVDIAAADPIRVRRQHRRDERPGDRNQFYAVLTQLKKYDVSQQKELMSVDLDHSYYCLNFSTDGSKVYLAGTFNDIAIHDADTLQKLGNIELPGGDMSLSTAQVFARLP